MKRCSFLAALAAIGLLSVSAHASTWTEVGDADPLPGTAQNTVGAPGLTQISGTLPSDSDVDMYAIRIVDHANFYAEISPLVAYTDPDIWLFDSTGKGVAMDDTVHGGAAMVNSALVSSNGIYYLAISSDNADAQSSGQNIWAAGYSPNAERAPDGPNPNGIIDNWGGSPHNDMMNYNVYLGGVDPVVLPEPGMVGAGIIIAATGMIRRKKHCDQRSR